MCSAGAQFCCQRREYGSSVSKPRPARRTQQCQGRQKLGQADCRLCCPDRSRGHVDYGGLGYPVPLVGRHAAFGVLCRRGGRGLFRRVDRVGYAFEQVLLVDRPNSERPRARRSRDRTLSFHTASGLHRDVGVHSCHTLDLELAVGFCTCGANGWRIRAADGS